MGEKWWKMHNNKVQNLHPLPKHFWDDDMRQETRKNW